MINHLTGFLNKCVLEFKRDNHLETLSSVKQKTQRPFGLDIFCVTNDKFLGNYPLQKLHLKIIILTKSIIQKLSIFSIACPIRTFSLI